MTLLELLVALSLFVIIMGAASESLIALYRSSSASSGSAAAISAARVTADAIVRDLRQATYSDAGAPPIATMGTSTLSFYENVDSGASVEKVTYALSGETLTKTVIAASGNPATYDGTPVVISTTGGVVNISSDPLFRYFDATGAEVSDQSAVSSIRRVSVSLVENAATSTLPDVEIGTSATLRNLLSL
jgi:type II secretory pathway pseudopilin PulG